MTYFLKNGKSFRPTAEASLDLHNELPVGTYTIKQDMFKNMFFETIDNFEFAAKRYGDNIRHTERIFSTFLTRDVSTGVMLAGEKGSGKSLLAKSLAIKGYENNVPTLVINEPWCGEDFNLFIQSIEQPCIIIFDEFEKVYKRDDQEQILTLLDGVYPSKKLFIITCNDKFRVDGHMRNRPGRIFYMIDFKGLSSEFITEYCEDNLNNKSYINQLCKIASLFSEFNFDMLKAMVEEMNRYNESPQEVMELLNAKPEFDADNKFSVVVEDEGVEYKEDTASPSILHGNPLSKSFEVGFYTTAEDSSDNQWYYADFSPSNLIELDPDTGTFVFMNEESIKVTLTRIRDTKINYWNAF